MKGRMCSLFIIVYLIETSLWVWSLVPAPPAASPALCPDTEGEMASSVPFWKLSSCQSGSDIFTMPPWAHLLCPHPHPRHCKPPSAPHPLALQQAGGRHQSQIHMWRTNRLQVSDSKLFLHFIFISVVLPPQTQNWPKQKIWNLLPCCIP